MKVTEIEVHQIMLEYQDFLAYQLNHYYGPTKRTIYIAHTDSGLEGLGESGLTEPPDVIQQYIVTNPFDWIGDETSLGLGTAMYDLMGQNGPSSWCSGLQTLWATLSSLGICR